MSTTKQQHKLPPQNEILLSAETKYKAEMGVLIATATKLMWVRQTSPNTPSLVINISDIRTQLAAQNPKLKIVLHSDVPSSTSTSSSSSEQVDIKKVPGSIFEFTSPNNAMLERNAFRDLIATLTKAFSSAVTSSIPIATTTTTNTASAAPPTLNPSSLANLGTVELKQRASLLASNRDLQILYNQLVKTQIISDEEFWQSRQDMLENETLKKDNQMTGMPTSMVSDVRGETLASTGEMKFVLTPSIIQHIFLEYPAVHRAFLKNVPEKMTEQQFWQRYCESQYIQRLDRTTTGGMSTITLAHHDELFAQCAEEDEKAASNPLTFEGVDVEPVRILPHGDHPEEGYDHPSDILNVPEHLNRSLRLIRRYNRHGSLVLQNHYNNHGAGDGSESISNLLEKHPIVSTSAIEDLREEPSLSYTPLNIPDHRKFFIQNTSNISSMTTQEISDDHLSKLFESELKQQRKTTKRDRTGVIRYLSKGKSISNDVLEEITTNTEVDSSKPLAVSKDQQLPSDIKEKLMVEFLTVNELLRHFWRLFPLTNVTKEKLPRLNAAISQYIDKLNLDRSKSSQQNKKYFLPLVNALNRAIEKIQSIEALQQQRAPPPPPPPPTGVKKRKVEGQDSSADQPT